MQTSAPPIYPHPWRIRMFSLVSGCAVLAALGLFAAFLQDWIPKSVNQGAPPWPAGAVGNILLLLAFGAAHSALARPAVKHRLYGHAGSVWTRPVYMLVTAVQLALLMVCWSPMPATLWEIPPTLSLALFASGNLIVIWAIVSIDAWHFFGLRQAFSPASTEPAFSLRGPYRYVRHPIQSGLVLALWSTPHLSAGHALLAGVLTLYSVMATLKLEERDLDAALGGLYAAYKRRVPPFIPDFRSTVRDDKTE